MKKKLFLGSILLSLDIISKVLIDYYLPLNKSYSLINNFFYITKVYNYGASFSMMNGFRLLLIILGIIILIFLYFYQKHFINNRRNNLAFIFLYTGIMGNLIDRIIRGYVIDYLDFKIFGYDYPVFNIADILIFMGVILLIIAIIKKEDGYGNKSSSK